jgi:hypothetical protein
MNITLNRRQRQTLLLSLLVINVVATFLHYADNFFFFDRYPAPTSMHPDHVYIAWLILTPFAVAGYIQYVRQKFWLAYVFLALYSLTSLGGVAHYFFGFVSMFSLKMHALIWFEELAGYSLVGFMVWSGFILKEWRREIQIDGDA